MRTPSWLLRHVDPVAHERIEQVRRSADTAGPLPADHPARAEREPAETILCNGCQGLFAGDPKEVDECPFCESQDLSRPAALCSRCVDRGCDFCRGGGDL